LNTLTPKHRRQKQGGFIKLHLPSVAILLSTIMWGTWWIPLHKLDELGAGTTWLLLAGVVLPAVLFLPRVRHSARAIARGGWPVALCALFIGVAATLYAEGAIRGNVARVILLFYLTPVWSTLLARLMLGEPITRARLISIVLGLTGMWIILGGDASSLIPRPRDLAEWMGLAAGVSWAFAMVYIQRTSDTHMSDLALPVFACFAITFLLVTLVPGGRSWAIPTIESWPVALLWVVLIALLWHIPAMMLTLFGATEVEPGRVAILLMMEVVIGVGSAAILSGQPFGAREIIGTVCVMCASVSDFVLPALLARQQPRQVPR